MELKKQTVLEIGQFPLVGLDIMNNTHFEEIEMVKELGESVNRYRDVGRSVINEESRITGLLVAWLEHTQVHFSRENKLMETIGFPMIDMHMGEHVRVLAEMTHIVSVWQANKGIESVAEYVFEIWPRWFEQHVETMDMITAQFAMMHGYDADATL